MKKNGTNCGILNNIIKIFCRFYIYSLTSVYGELILSRIYKKDLSKTIVLLKT